ncbi:MAG: hypothetical protein KF685_10300 [Acidobacteria bacterium]|nr:hypothetical protein [Acidobacteriota bacterium]
MLEFKEIDKPDSTFSNIGRISYCVFAVIPIILWIVMGFQAGETREERFAAFLMGSLLLVLSLIITIVGAIILVLVKISGQPIRFWVIAVAIASLPLWLGFILGVLWNAQPVFGAMHY